MSRTTSHDVTRLLGEINQQRASVSDLLPMVYAELRAQAAAYTRRQAPGHSLNSTALVHEVAARLLDHAKTDWSDRAHFFAVCAKAMRQVLADHARRRSTEKRGGRWQRVTLAYQADPNRPATWDTAAIDQALTELGALNRRMSEVVEYRFFAGMTNREIARVLGVSIATVENDWRAARAWLGTALKREAAG